MSLMGVALLTVFASCLTMQHGLPEIDQSKSASNINPSNTLEYFRSVLSNREVWLREDVVFGREWYGRRKDVTNVLEDGVWYRSHALAERDVDRFIIAAASSKWGAGYCEEHYTPHILYRGEKVYVFKVSQKRQNILVAYLMAESGLKTGVFFDFRKDALGIPPQEADHYISKIFAFSEEELLADETKFVAIGMSEAEVLEVSGPPIVKLFPEPGVVVYVYDNYKVVLKNGEVDEIRY
jgi:hypothetical protein